jgi:putative PIN family toxin of toxin-antitoxin system
VTRVCLDSNVLVAAFAARGLCSDVLALVISEHELIVPEVVVDEVRRVLSAKLHVSSSALGLLEAFFDRCEVVPRTSLPSPIKLRDSSDEPVLAAAIQGGADILVSGDNDLLAVAHESPIRILSPRAFMMLVHGSTL